MERLKQIEWLLRIGVFGIFLGHGMFAWQGKESWIPYLLTVGFSESTARFLLPYIGSLDILVAFLVLLKPLRIFILWAFIWTLATALIRPLSGESIWQFVERAGNWTVPLVLLILKGIPQHWRDWWRE
ncbi:MAG: hypothetical protein AAFU64_05720 [Bacteroidota bacterium]